jgi:hypothetical protein
MEIWVRKGRAIEGCELRRGPSRSKDALRMTARTGDGEGGEGVGWGGWFARGAGGDGYIHPILKVRGLMVIFMVI